ncbi:MAG: hypothetical protein R2733_01395 [Acidimicrobiales bacterium]
MTTSSLRLGLVGSGIARSMAPAFHIRAGQLSGIDITYELLEHDAGEVDQIPALIEHYRSQGFDGLNVTFSFKERVAAITRVDDPSVRVIGAVNTVLLGGDQPQPVAHNTDFSGFQRRWHHRWPYRSPGVVALVGTGGVGRALAFALGELGAIELRLFDLDSDKSRLLAAALESRFDHLTVVMASTAEAAADGADGVVNGTPIGMYFAPGAPVDLDVIGSQAWLFDAVYSPIGTPLLVRARERGVDVLSGFELFLGQGLDAYAHFTGGELDPSIATQLEAELWQAVDTAPGTKPQR